MKVTKAAGLFTSDNPYGTVPDGAFTQADNVVIRNKDVVEPRRGQEYMAYAFAVAEEADEIFFFGTTAVVAADRGGGAYTMEYDTGSAFSNVTSGVITAPDFATLRIKAVEANQNFYLTTYFGLDVLSAPSGSVASAGVLPPFDLVGTSAVSSMRGNPNATDAWFASNTAVAYRATWIVVDANNNLKESAPTGRFVVVNPADSSSAIGGLVRAANVVTATTSAAHGLQVGDIFILDAAEVGPPAFGTGPFTVVKVPTSTTLTYAEVGANGASANTHTIKSGLKTTSITVAGPNLLTTNHHVRLYRTAASPTASVDPGDECFLVYERRCTATDVTAGFVSVTDITPEAFLGAPLYTNEISGEGAVVANDAPPRGKDVALWRNRLWLGNTFGPERFEIRLLGTGSPNGIQNNDLLVVNGHIYEFVNTDLGGVATAAYRTITHYEQYSAPRNTQLTAASLSRVFETYFALATERVRALPTSGPDDPAGMLTIDSLTPSDTPFYVAASRNASFSPTVPVASKVQNTSARVASTVTVNTATAHGFAVGQSIYLASNSPLSAFSVGTKTVATTPSGTQFTYTEAGTATTFDTTYVVHALDAVSDNDARPNAVFYSREQELEAFPGLNYLLVGAKNSAILRIVPLRDKLYVFKEDGIYTVSGQYPFRVDLLDNTVKLVAPDSIAIVSNRIYALTTQGVVQVTEGGVGIISRAIETDILPLLTNASAGFKRACFGVGYETERSYMLWIPSSASSSTTDRAYVYHVLNQTWTKRTDTRRCGRVSPSDYLYLGTVGSSTLSKERKSFDATDYSDESFAVTVTSGTATTAVLTSVSGITVGDYFIQGTVKGPITAINSLTVTFTADGSGAPSAATATIYKGYPCALVYAPQTGGAPGTSKHFRELTLHFGTSDFELGAITTQSELSTSATSDTITTAGALGTLPKNLRKLIPLQNSRCAVLQPGFAIREARGGWRLYGYSIEGEAMSERTMK